MTFVETYLANKDRYYGQTLGEAFVNYHWPGKNLHKNQQKLYDQKNNDKANFIIVMCYNDLNTKFNGDIYEQTTEASPPIDNS